MERGSILSILSRKGGTGRSFVAVNVAVSLRQITRKPVLLIDLNMPYSGDCLMQLGLGAVMSMAENAAKIDFLTGAVLQGSIVTHPLGVAVLPACTSVELSRLVTPEVVQKHLQILQEIYSYIVVDHGAEISEEDFVVLDNNTLSLIIVEPELLAINQTRKMSEFLRAIHYPGDRIQFAVNKFADDPKITLGVIQSNIDKAPLGVIPEDRAAVQESVLSGRPLSRKQDNDVAIAIHELAEKTLYWLDRFGTERAHGISRQFLRNNEEGGEEVATGIAQKDLIELKIAVHTRLVREMSMQEFGVSNRLPTGRELEELQMRTEAVVSRILDDEGEDLISSTEAKKKIAREIVHEAIGLGPIEGFLADPAISEIMINGADQIYVERSGRIVLSEDRFTSEDQLRRIIERIVIQVGRRIDEQSPLVDARLVDGSRVNAVIPPIALDGSKLTIRKFSKRRLKVDDLINFGTLTRQMSLFLQAAILSRKNILISGGTGSGKTTLLNILSSYIPDDERIVTIEDSAELQLPQDHVVRLETRPINIEGKGEISIRDLVRNSLRMRPDRIIIGECRGGEALDMLQAMNTGHDGSLTTAHANTPRDALSRLETMCLMAGMDLPARAIREQIGSAVHLIIQQSRMQDGSRKVTYITEIAGMEGDKILMQDLFRYEQRGVDAEGKVSGMFSPTGNIPTFLDELVRKGVGINREIFVQQRV